MYDEVVKLISTVGFPIGICVYLLVRFENKIERFNRTISEFKAVITAVIGNQKKL